MEDVAEIVAGIEDGSWIDASLSGFGGSLEALSVVMDPLGSVVSWGVGWLIEHVAPLREALDALAGDAAAVSSHAAAWENVAVAMSAARDSYLMHVGNDTAGWFGAAGDSYRTHAVSQLAAMEGIGVAAGGIASAVMGAGVVVALVREVVRDLIAEFVATLAVRLPQWLALEGLTAGLATPVVVGRVAGMVAEWARRIERFVRGLLASLRRLIPRTDSLSRAFDELLMNSGGKARPSSDGSSDPSPSPSPLPEPGGKPPKSSDATTEARDIHGALRNASRDVDPDYVWANGEMYIQDDGRIVKVLDNGNGTYHVVIRDMSNRSDTPNTVLENVSERYLQRKLDDGRWQ